MFLAPSVGWSAVDISLNLQDGLASSGFAYILVGSSSVLLALAMVKVNPNFVLEGVWVWILPAALELLSLGFDAYHFGAASLGGDFAALGPGRGEQSLVFVFLTLPAFGCCLYSFAMWRFGKRLHDLNSALSA